jgi:dTDP-4-dehydrorhamnose 3,5-epimerase
MNPKLVYKSNIIQNLVIIQPNIFYDNRGENFEGYNNKLYKILFKEANLKNINFKIDSFSISNKNVLRGFHGDKNNWKLIDIIYGEVNFVVIDTRKTSITYKNIEYIILNNINKYQVLVPAGCVNAHYVLSNKCIFHYKLSKNYVKQKDQIHIKWNDPVFNVNWNLTTIPILSNRDL